MGIKHSATKASGEEGTHAEWNADHVFTGDQDMLQHQFLNQVIEHVAAFPGGPVEGQVIYRTDQHTFYHWNGTNWVALVGPATIVVAADGSGQTADIQEGIDMLPVTGGVVYIKEGTYPITAAIVIDSDNVSLIGAGKSTEITTGNNIIMLDARKGGAPTVDGLLVENIYFNGAGAGHAANVGIMTDAINSTISKCWVENCGAQGILWDTGGTQSILAHNYVSNNVGTGIQFGGSYGLVNGNTAYSNDASGMLLGGSFIRVLGNYAGFNVEHGLSLTGFSHGVLTNNICVFNDSGNTASFDGIYLTNSDANVFSNNRCRDNDRDGIRIDNINCDDNVVMGNHCTGNTGASITDNGNNTLPNGAVGTNNLELDDLNYV